MTLWLRKKYEIMWLRLAVYVLDGRNFARCRVVSRRDNKGMSYSSERIEAVIKRIELDYNVSSYEY